MQLSYLYRNTANITSPVRPYWKICYNYSQHCGLWDKNHAFVSCKTSQRDNPHLETMLVSLFPTLTCRPLRQKEIHETKWFSSESKKHIELTAPFDGVWVMTEQVADLSGRAQPSVFWHKHGVQVLMEECCEPVWPPVFWRCPRALSLVRFHVEFVLLVGVNLVNWSLSFISREFPVPPSIWLIKKRMLKWNRNLRR